jgi:hypothetical protein
MNNIITEEQKGCSNKTYGTKDQLLINKTIIENSKKNQRNLSMAWIDYKKAYNSVPHSWINKILEIYKIHPCIQNLMKNTMPKWNTNITLQHSKGEIVIENTKIRRGIFQGDSLSPLLFIMALNPLSHNLRKQNLGYQMEARNKDSPKVSHLLYMDDLKLYAPNEDHLKRQVHLVAEFTQDICMDFGLDKCAKITLKKGKPVHSQDLEVQNYTIQNLNNEESYKYLGIEESNEIHHKNMKIKIKNEYIHRVKKILKTQLNNKNIISAITALALPVVTYSFGVIDWYQHEINEMDVKTRKLLHANKCIHKNMCIPRLYIKRREGGLGLIEIDQAHRIAIVGLDCYLQHHNNQMLKITNASEEKKPPTRSIKKKAKDYRTTLNQPDLVIPERHQNKPPTEIAKFAKKVYKKGKEKDREEKWEDHNYSKAYKKDVLNKKFIDKDTTTAWLRYGMLRKETESLIIAAQDKGLKTNWFMKWIAGKDVSDKCRLCNDGIETPNHILSGCKIFLENGTYTARHDQVCKYIHWRLCQYYKLETDSHYWKHEPPPILERDTVRITFDQPILTDLRLPHNRPDIVVIDKLKKKNYIIEIGVPNDFRISAYEIEKRTKYAQLTNELRRLTGNATEVVPIIIGSTGAVKTSISQNIKSLPTDISLTLLIKLVLNSSASILNRFLAC